MSDRLFALKKNEYAYLDEAYGYDEYDDDDDDDDEKENDEKENDEKRKRTVIHIISKDDFRDVYKPRIPHILVHWFTKRNLKLYRIVCKVGTKKGYKLFDHKKRIIMPPSLGISVHELWRDSKDNKLA